MKKMNELKVGEQAVVTVEHVDLGYATVDGIEYFVKGSDDLEIEVEYNSLDCYYVAKDDSKIFVLGEDSEFPVANVKRIQ
jgi:hypothetical protein